MLQDNQTPAPVALAVARAEQDAVPHSTIILFGSRAAGTCRPNSDVDLMLVYKDFSNREYSSAYKAVRNYFKQNPPALNVDIVPMEFAEFHYSRRAPNHVAGQATRKGIAMNNEGLESSADYSDGYPPSWPDVKERLRSTYRCLRAFEVNFRELPNDQETYGFQAQQAVENSLKAWISAANLEYSGVHDLDAIAQSVLDDPVESQTLAAAQLRILLDYSTAENPDEPGTLINWLTQYVAWYRYHGTRYTMTAEGKARFREEILLAVYTFINRAQELTGTTDEDLAR